VLLRVRHPAGQAVDLVDHHHVDPARIDVGQQALQGGPLQGAAGHAAVVVALADRAPALVLLAGDVGRAGSVLRVEGVEALLQPLLGGLAGVDCAADGAPAAHAATSFASKPKNRGPDQRVPVIARATADKDR
jgi:hypothetical protein